MDCTPASGAWKPMPERLINALLTLATGESGIEQRSSAEAFWEWFVAGYAARRSAHPEGPGEPGPTG